VIQFVIFTHIPCKTQQYRTIWYILVRLKMSNTRPLPYSVNWIAVTYSTLCTLNTEIAYSGSMHCKAWWKYMVRRAIKIYYETLGQ